MGRLIDADATLDFIKANFRIRPEFIIEHAPTVEAIPKDQYEARLKADMVAMLTELQLEIEEKASAEGDWIFAEGERFCGKLIQQKINALKENTDGNI